MKLHSTKLTINLQITHHLFSYFQLKHQSLCQRNCNRQPVIIAYINPLQGCLMKASIHIVQSFASANPQPLLGVGATRRAQRVGAPLCPNTGQWG